MFDPPWDERSEANESGGEEGVGFGLEFALRVRGEGGVRVVGLKTYPEKKTERHADALDRRDGHDVACDAIVKSK